MMLMMIIMRHSQQHVLLLPAFINKVQSVKRSSLSPSSTRRMFAHYARTHSHSSSYSYGVSQSEIVMMNPLNFAASSSDCDQDDDDGERNNEADDDDEDFVAFSSLSFFSSFPLLSR